MQNLFYKCKTFQLKLHLNASEARRVPFIVLNINEILTENFIVLKKKKKKCYLIN